MTRDEYVTAVAQAAQALASGELGWDGHYVRLRELQAGYSREHGAGWPGVVQAALLQEPTGAAS